ncbi:MAG: hypothetical protein J5800_08625 [Spirochaetales bacterium]|nr:hypothetical protein [Spirochaetales bacterium]
MGKTKLLKIAVMAIAILLFSAGAVFAAEKVNYTFEVKFLLDSEKILGSDHVPVKDLQDLFAVKKTNQRVVLYIDSADRKFNDGGWINRVREKEGKKNVELAYKKRYAVQGTDIEGAIEKAIKDNPRITDGRYEAEIDWGYDKMTLSFTAEVKIDKPAGGLKGMSEADLLSNLLANMPDDEQGWMFAKFKSSKITDARIAGPVDYIRYVGSYKDVEIDIEVWNVKGTYITELSFEADDIASATALRNEIMGILDGRGILLHKDSLKTQMILDAYL